MYTHHICKTKKHPLRKYIISFVDSTGYFLLIVHTESIACSGVQFTRHCQGLRNIDYIGYICYCVVFCLIHLCILWSRVVHTKIFLKEYATSVVTKNIYTFLEISVKRPLSQIYFVQISGYNPHHQWTVSILFEVFPIRSLPYQKDWENKLGIF